MARSIKENQIAAEKPTDFKQIVENAQRTVAQWPEYMRRNRDEVHVPIRRASVKKK